LEFLGLNLGRRDWDCLKSDWEAEGGGPIGVVDGMGSSGRLAGVEGASEGSEGTANDMLARYRLLESATTLGEG
jgi:hypothetical protein